MTRCWICVGMQLRKRSEYSRIPSMQGFCVCKRCTKFGICLNMANQCPMAGLWICLVKVWQVFKKVPDSKYAMAPNMARSWICEGYTGCWVCLNKPWVCLNNVSICVNMPWYSITLNMIEYIGIYLKNRMLNVPAFWMCLIQYIA